VFFRDNLRLAGKFMAIRVSGINALEFIRVNRVHFHSRREGRQEMILVSVLCVTPVFSVSYRKTG